MKPSELSILLIVLLMFCLNAIGARVILNRVMNEMSSVKTLEWNVTCTVIGIEWPGHGCIINRTSFHEIVVPYRVLIDSYKGGELAVVNNTLYLFKDGKWYYRIMVPFNDTADYDMYHPASNAYLRTLSLLKTLNSLLVFLGIGYKCYTLTTFIPIPPVIINVEVGKLPISIEIIGFGVYRGKIFMGLMALTFKDVKANVPINVHLKPMKGAEELGRGWYTITLYKWTYLNSSEARDLIGFAPRVPNGYMAVGMILYRHKAEVLCAREPVKCHLITCNPGFSLSANNAITIDERPFIYQIPPGSMEANASVVNNTNVSIVVKSLRINLNLNLINISLIHKTTWNVTIEFTECKVKLIKNGLLYEADLFSYNSGFIRALKRDQNTFSYKVPTLVVKTETFHRWHRFLKAIQKLLPVSPPPNVNGAFLTQLDLCRRNGSRLDAFATYDKPYTLYSSNPFWGSYSSSDTYYTLYMIEIKNASVNCFEVNNSSAVIAVNGTYVQLVSSTPPAPLRVIAGMMLKQEGFCP